MSIFDTVMGAVQQHSDVNQEQHSNLVQTALQMFGNHAGLSGLINNAQSQGLGQIVQSWVSTGPIRTASCVCLGNSAPLGSA